jgi:hypothetical protein
MHKLLKKRKYGKTNIIFISTRTQEVFDLLEYLFFLEVFDHNLLNEWT